jgi:hypothetical protein
MTEYQHPITPQPEIRRIWAQQAQRMNPHDPVAWIEHVATQAARWGADAELRACCEWVDAEFPMYPKSDGPASYRLANARRPKPPSLAEQALNAAKNMSDWMEHGFVPERSDLDTIRAALERLQELENNG